MNPRRAFLILAAVVAGAGLAYGLGGTARFVLHFLLCQVNHGTSAGKMIFLLTFLFVGFLVLAASGEPAGLSRGRRGRLAVLAGSLLIGAVASMGSCILYARAHGLGSDAVSFHWREGINSVNSFAHVHTSKAVVANLAEALGAKGFHERFDTGWAYASAVPYWLAALSGAALVAAVVAGLAAAPPVVGRYPRRQRPAVACVYLLAAAAASKCILDGGPLAYDGLVASATLWMLAGNADLRGFWTRRALWLMPLALAVLWLAALRLWVPSVWATQAQRAGYRAALYGLILAPALAATGPGRSRRVAGAAAAILAVVAGAGLAESARASFWPFFQPAPARAARYVDGRVNWASLPAGNLLEACLAVGQDPFRSRNVSLAAAKARSASGFYAELIPLGGRGEVAFAPDPLVRIAAAEASEDGRRIRLKVVFDPLAGPAVAEAGPGGLNQPLANERFVGYRLLDAYLRRAGLDEYILLPYGFFREPRPVSCGDSAPGPAKPELIRPRESIE